MGTTGLFANQREANLTSTIAMVEEALISLGHVVEKSRVEFPECAAAWRIAKGSASIEIALLEHGDAGWLQVSASVMTPGSSTEKSALWRKILLLNAERTSSASFGLRGDTVVLIGQRTTRDLDRGEVHHLIETVSDDADHFDDELVSEFGGRRGD